MGGRDVHIDRDDMVVSEMLVDISGRDLAGRNRADNGRGAGDRVAARKHMGRVGYESVGLRLNLAADNRGDLLERLCVNRLADGNDNNIAGDAEQRFPRVFSGADAHPSHTR